MDGDQPPTVMIPITCPACGTYKLMEYPAIVVEIATTRWNNMRLSSPCHDVAWDASSAEIRAINEFLGPMWMESLRR